MYGKFFIECGAYNGERYSNTLTLERRYGWRGVLIEGNPQFKAEVLSKRRKAYFLPHCLSLTNEVGVSYRFLNGKGLLSASNHSQKSTITRKSPFSSISP